jgi:hypothetical protein
MGRSTTIKPVIWTLSTAPNTPGTYYIGIFAGWMYTCDEVASNDHPANYDDGDDVWDMSSQRWEEVISNGQASTGPYQMPGRAIRIVRTC